ncbi:VWA domain-containing protein [Prevotella sp. HUN102]|uniref:vWA domain-containing protein n=1 Tax=Prevotella sp. HUN102 TaxID=1392486 RepID=UPI00048E6782|nr:VWA domain-containing protein [Prevotella sp. HUN102]
MEFANKEYLLLLLLLIPYLLWYFFRRKGSEPTMRMADTYVYEYAPKSWRMRLIHLPMLLRCLTYALVVMVLARPQTDTPSGADYSNGINIMLAMDVSTSMLSQDVAPNRMEVAKDVANEFISARPSDNIGLTIFAGEAFTQCPMTTDHASLLNLLQNVNTDLASHGLIEDGTAIGMGLANAVNRLKDIKAKSKVVILLTDGSNNKIEISPMTAAEIAKKFGIRVYTIGLGTDKNPNVPNQMVGEIDYKTLQDIARTTNGEFYRAQSRQELSQIYKDIDKLEKAKISGGSFGRRYEAYMPFALLALFSFLMEIVFRIAVFKRIP